LLMTMFPAELAVRPLMVSLRPFKSSVAVIPEAGLMTTFPLAPVPVPLGITSSAPNFTVPEPMVNVPVVVGWLQSVLAVPFRVRLPVPE
ncbi:MAG: hypothetical protein ACK56I_23360, partial [bacterium]